MIKQIEACIEGLKVDQISEQRLQELNRLAEVIKSQKDETNLNFICTHNSRRSQFAQVWAHTMARYFSQPIQSFSGGVEITACNPRTVKALESCGFIATNDGGTNPVYNLTYDHNREPIILFSKLHSDASNPEDFVAVMTCDHADQNCPFIPNAVARIPLTYIDPKRSDDTPDETKTYYNTSLEIATEMKYLFSQL